MTGTNGQEYYQTSTEKLNDEDKGNEIIQTDTSNLDSEEDDSVGGDVDGDGSINIDEYDRTSLASLKKTKSEVNATNNTEYEKNDVKSTDTTITSEISNEEKIDEFDDPDYESNVIKRAKGTSANKPASFTCMICSYRTNRKFLLSQHLTTHSDERPFKCDLCRKHFKTRAVLQRHQNIHLVQKPHACSSCDMAFSRSEELKRHERSRHTQIKPHKCTECDYRCVELFTLRRHMRSHIGERPHQCPHCTYAAQTISCLKSHMDVHNGEKPYECDICHARLKRPNSLKMHRLIHTGEKPYECDICHARFTHHNSLKKHRLKHSATDKPVFHCHLCPTTCGSSWHLSFHMKKLHSTDQPIPCKRCGKELPDLHSYSTHRKTHVGEKCYRCEYCPYTATTPNLLKSHFSVHLDAKRFSCEICGTNFRHKHNMARHMKISHSDNSKKLKMDNKCPHCKKSFAFNEHLMRHMEIHDADEEPVKTCTRLNDVKPDGTVIIESENLSGDNEELRNEETEEQEVDDEKLQAEYEEIEEYSEDNLQNIYDEYEADEYEEQPKNVQYVEQSDETNEKKTLIIDIKPEEIQEMDIAQTSFKKSIISSKAENKQDSEIKIEIHDNQGFMVIKVTPDDGGGEEK